MTRCGLPRDLEPVRQLVGERIAVVEKAARLDEQPPRIGARPPGHPADRPRAGQLLQDIDGLADVLALDVLGHIAVVDPAIAVADHLMAARDEGVGQRRILLQRARHAENADRQPRSRGRCRARARRRGGCHIRTPIRPAARARRLIGRHADVVEHALRHGDRR